MSAQRLNFRERQRRMQEVGEAAWQEIETLPGAIREGYFERPRMPIEILTCPLGKEVNHGGLLRIAESFMLERVLFSFEKDGAHDFSGHRGAMRWQPYDWRHSEELLQETEGRQVVALTLIDSAVSFDQIDYRFPLSIVVGQEKEGVPEWMVDKAEHAIAIPMYGLMGSLNVATATAIVVQHIASQYAKAHGFQPIRTESQRLIG
jgi:tRNA G18 (ribose-2'-O)-methylase SpoU